MRKITATTAAAAVVLSSFAFAATPAEARHRQGGRGHHHHQDRIDAGDVIGGLFVIGAIAAIASAASKDRRDRDARYDPPRPEWDRRTAPDYREQAPDYAPGDYSADTEASRAADACGWAVEGELGRDARIDVIGDPRPDGDGWDVEGSATFPDGEARDFRCQFRAGRVIDVRID